LNSPTAYEDQSKEDQSKQATTASNTAFAEPHQAPQVSEGLLGSLAQAMQRSNRIRSKSTIFLSTAVAFVIRCPRPVFPQNSQGRELKVSR
jgi:hypothetical protein